MLGMIARTLLTLPGALVHSVLVVPIDLHLPLVNSDRIMKRAGKTDEAAFVVQKC